MKRLTAAMSLAAVLSGCSTTVPGHGVSINYANNGIGPAVGRTPPIPSVVFAPGVEVSIGTGNNAVTCTAGWIAQTKNSGFFFTAGHCARTGVGAPVRSKYAYDGKTEEVELGAVSSTTFSDEYSPRNPDIAVITIHKTPSNQNLPLSAYPGTGMVVSIPVQNAETFAKKANGERVCWFTEVDIVPTVSRNKHCGTVSSGSGTQLMVSPDDSNGYRPEFAGAPVVWTPGTSFTGDDQPPNIGDSGIPVGIVTGMDGDQVSVNTVSDVLNKSGAIILVPPTR